MTNMREFGRYPNGESAVSITLESGPLTAEIISHGASLRKLIVGLPSGPRNIVLGLEDLDTYIAHGSHVGATAGRFAGKIPHGILSVDGNACHLSLNAGGEHHVHGGHNGLGRRNWTLLEATETSAKFQIVSADGDDGYPGDLTVTCTYKITDTDLMITYESVTNRKTPLNLLHHSYFNLDGTGTIHGQTLHIPSKFIVERDFSGNATGSRIAPNVDFDFQTPRKIEQKSAFDTTYVLRDDPTIDPVFAARVFASQKDLKMDVLTTEPSLHFYDGGKLNVPHNNDPNLDLTPYQGLCLEPTRGLQTGPEAPIRYAMLVKGETYIQKTIYRLVRI